MSQALTPRLATAAAVLLLSACVSVMPVPDVPQRRHREPAAEPERAAHRSTSLTISGSGLDWHDVGAYMKPDAIGRYSFVGDTEIRFNPPGRQFDAALLMDCSQCPVNPQLRPIFFEFAKKHSDTLRRHGVEPMLLMTWAYQDKPEMTQGLADAYTEAGRLCRAHVVPAGLAFACSSQARPDMNLYVADGPIPVASRARRRAPRDGAVRGAVRADDAAPAVHEHPARADRPGQRADPADVRHAAVADAAGARKTHPLARRGERHLAGGPSEHGDDGRGQRGSMVLAPARTLRELVQRLNAEIRSRGFVTTAPRQTTGRARGDVAGGLAGHRFRR